MASGTASGTHCVNFGSPLSMRAFCLERGVDPRALPREDRFREVEALAGALMGAVGKVIPVLPVPLVATAFLRDPAARRSELELKADVVRLMGELERAGAHVYSPRADQDFAVTVGLRMLTLRKLVEESDGLYSAVPGEIPLLSYYANSIRHLLAAAPAGRGSRWRGLSPQHAGPPSIDQGSGKIYRAVQPAK